jgi:hypothetical protein
VRLGLIELTLVGEAATWGFWESWMLDAHRRQSGRLIFFQNEDQKAKTVIFYDAFCVHYTCRFDARGADGQGSFEVEINLSAAAKEVQGQFSEAHSVIPWDADKDTRYRALTKPTEYLPTVAISTKPVQVTAPEAADFMRFNKEKKPLDQRAKSSKTGYLNSPKLTRVKRSALVKEAEEAYATPVYIVSAAEMRELSGSTTVRALFQTEYDPLTKQRTGAIYVQKGATAYELTHEMMHAKQFHQLGYEAYWLNQTHLQREEYVLDELMKVKQQLSAAEIENAVAYIHFMKNGFWPNNG